MMNAQALDEAPETSRTHRERVDALNAADGAAWYEACRLELAHEDLLAVEAHVIAAADRGTARKDEQSTPSTTRTSWLDILGWVAAVALLIALAAPRVLLHSVGLPGMALMGVIAWRRERRFGPLAALQLASAVVHAVALTVAVSKGAW